MDTRRFLLAEHYDSLGLFKIADSLDKYDLTKQPKTKQNKNQATKNNGNNQDVIENTLGKLEPALQAAEPYLGPLGVVFTISEINNLSKQALNIHAIQKLSEIAKKGSINAAQKKYLLTLSNNAKIEPQVVQILRNVINNQIPSLEQINALKPTMPNISKTASDFIGKMKNVAKNNPAEAEVAEKVSKELGKKIAIFKTIGRTVPIAFVLLNALMIYPEAKKYFLKISAGDIDEIFEKPDTRAKFCVFLADITAFFTSFFPPLAPVTAALTAISAGYQGGMYLFDKYNEITGEKEKETLESQFAEDTRVYDRPKSLHDKYVFYIGKDKKIKSQVVGESFHQNIIKLVSEYLKSSINNVEAAYAIKILVLPEILRFIDEALIAGKKTLNLKDSTIMSLPVLRTGKAISQKYENGYRQKQIAPVSFIVDPQNPKNRQAMFEFTKAITYIVSDVNQSYYLLRNVVNETKAKPSKVNQSSYVLQNNLTNTNKNLKKNKAN
jgi:hypothetical protein